MDFRTEIAYGLEQFNMLERSRQTLTADILEYARLYRNRTATDLRDKVYGFAGLASDPVDFIGTEFRFKNATRNSQ
jgi:hypothetical protein